MSEIVSGVYLIRCIPTDKVYVGSSTNIKARWTQHKRDFAKSQGGCIKLRNAWLKHGAESFTWEVLEAVEPDRLIEREQHFIDLYQAADRNRGFNTRRFANSNRGVERSEEHRAKLAAALRGKPLPPEMRAKISQAKLGRPLSPEHRASIANAQHQLHGTLDRRRAKEESRAKRQKQKFLQKDEKDWTRTVKRCIAYAKFLAAAQSPETQAKRTAAIREARKKSEYKYSPEAQTRMAEGGSKGKRGTQKQQKRRAIMKSLEGLKFD